MTESKNNTIAHYVSEFLNKRAPAPKREGSFALVEMMQKASGEAPELWSNGLIGFGEVKHQSPSSGKVVDWFRMGLAQSKAN